MASLHDPGFEERRVFRNCLDGVSVSSAGLLFPVSYAPRLPQLLTPTRRKVDAFVRPSVVAAESPRTEQHGLPEPQDWRGPDPYVDYNRRFTPEDGIAITYKTIDENGWRTALRAIVLLAIIALAVTYAVKGSPYPMIPRGCPVFGPCAIPLRGDRFFVDAVLLIGFSGLCAWILFAEVQVYREIEIRADCMILDSSDVFWAEKFDLGWPQFVRGADGMQVLTGVYGTRQTEFLKVKAFDEFDRGSAVLAAHLAAAMQQQWGQPGQNA